MPAVANRIADPMCEGSTQFTLQGAALTAHPGGLLWWATEATLVVADLHLEKGSSFARKGQFLPPYDTRSTLARLTRLVDDLAPRRIISLGDSFHDGNASARLCEEDLATLTQLQSQGDWIWIAGNHDPLPPQILGGHACEELSIGPLTFRHEPIPGSIGEVAGHLHPCAKVRSASRSVRRPCFVEDGRRLLLPSFGALTGGLNVHHHAFQGLFKTNETCLHLVGNGRIYSVDWKQSLPSGM